MKTKILGLLAASILATPAVTTASPVTYQFAGVITGVTSDPSQGQVPSTTLDISNTWQFSDFVDNLIRLNPPNPYETSCAKAGAYICDARFYLNYPAPSGWPDEWKSGVALTLEYYTPSGPLFWGYGPTNQIPFPCPAGAFSTVGTFQCWGGTLTVTQAGGPEVPEPGTLALLGLGLAGLGLSRRRKAH